MRNRTVIALLVLCLGSAARLAYACSDFVFEKNGYSLLAHNMDWVSGEGMVVINKRHVQKRGFQVENTPEFKWTSKYGSISLTFDGRESTGRGLNEAGLVIFEAALGATQQSRDHNLPLLSVAQWTQYQLDTSASVEDVIASDKVVRIWPDDMQSHFLVRDKSGTVAVIEWLNGQMAVYKGSTLPVPAIVNSAYESCVTDGDDPSGRFKPIAEGLSSYDATKNSDGLDYVYSLLREVSNKLSFPVRTMWSVVFDLRAMRLYISTVQNSELRFLDMKDFDFSCQTDVEVLDINAPGSGNIRASFVPYTTDFNRTIVKRTYDIYSSYGVTTPDDVIEKTILFPETTTCADTGTGGSGVGGTGGGVGGATTSSGGNGGSQPPAGGSGAGGTSSAGTGSTVSSGASSGCSCALGASGHGSAVLIVLLFGLGMMARCYRRRA